MSEHGYGGFWIRLLALLVDSVIVATAMVVFVFAVIVLDVSPTMMTALGVVYGVGPYLYWVVMHASERQATYGKALLGMTVTTADGERISLLRSFGRELGKILSTIPLMLGYVVAAFTERKQALHDVVASTTVVRHSSGRVGLALLVGVFGWLAPAAIIFVAGVGMFTSQFQRLNPGVLQSAVGRSGADSTPSADTSVQLAAMPAARDTSLPNASPPAGAAAAVASDTSVATPPLKVASDTRAAAPTPAPVVLAAATTATAGAPRPPRPRPEAPPSISALDSADAAALDQLSGRFATEIALVPARLGDRPVQLWDFGPVARGDAARIFWPIHGFDARGNPVAIRGQRPIFTTLPRLGEYSGLWQLVYVVTADMAQPNALRDAAQVDAAVRARRAVLREAGLVLQLPIVARGSLLARDTTRAMLGWYKGRDVEFFDFGAATPAPRWGLAAGADSAGNAITLVVDSATAARHLQLASVGDSVTSRAPSPLRAFSDLRTAAPPRPTRSP